MAAGLMRSKKSTDEAAVERRTADGRRIVRSELAEICWPVTLCDRGCGPMW